jgi:hypothetical protein
MAVILLASTYVCVDAIQGCCFVIDKTTFNLSGDAASFFVNPFTTLCILDAAASTFGFNALIHTAAASQLGL